MITAPNWDSFRRDLSPASSGTAVATESATSAAMSVANAADQFARTAYFSLNI